MPTRRQLRVNNLLQEEISRIIHTEIHDPDIGFVTITGVETTADLREARVYASVLGDEEEVRHTMAALTRARSAIRSKLGHHIRLKYTPQLAFELDETARHAQRIETLINQFQSELQKTDHSANSKEAAGSSDDQYFAPVIDQIAQLLTQQQPTAIFIHCHPDGDAIGSGLALSLALQQQEQFVPVVCADSLPARYQFLPATERLSTQAPTDFEVALVVDAADRHQLGAVAKAVDQAQTVVWIDHHRTNQGGADIDYLNPAAPATALLVRPIIEAIGAEITSDIATCLYTALATDTGFFTFENTTAQALAAGAQLIQEGADPYAIAQAVNKQHKLSALRLQGQALVSLNSTADGRIVYAQLTPGDFSAAQAESEDTEGIIDLLKMISNSEVQVLFKAITHNQWRISLRSSLIDVAAIAQKFGGGGHVAAAGCTMTGSLPEVRARMLKTITSALDERQ